MAGATGFNFFTPALVADTKYWARMTYAAGHVDSAAATVYVTAGPISASGVFTECDRKFDRPVAPAQLSGSNSYYKTFAFTVPVDGNYTFTANAYATLYQGGFSPESPLVNLYGLGSGTHALIASPNKYYLVLSSPKLADISSYTVTVTAGPALVTKSPTPGITTQPVSTNVLFNQTATLKVISPTADLSYQWYVGSSCGTKFPISGANSSSYTTPAVKDFTNYWVELSTVGGYLFSAMATVGVTPQAVDDTVTNMEDTVKQQAPSGVLVNDLKALSRSLSAVNVVQPLHGSVILATNGGYQYKPTPNYCGADQFKYQVTDGTATSAVATVSITVMPVNDAPVAGPDSLQTAFNVPISVSTTNLLANDTDVEGDALAITAVTPTSALGGTVTLNNGLVTYNPQGHFGQDSFQYTVKDSGGASASGMVTVIVSNPDFMKLLITSMNSTNCHLQFIGKPSHGYWVKYAESPAGPWSYLGQVTTSPAGLGDVNDPTTPQPASRVYRLADVDVE